MPMNCENCKHFNYVEENCWLARDLYLYDEDNCPYCEYEVEQTDEEKQMNAGDIEAHRIMVEGE